ncbi:MAG: hypothetical protein KA319_06625 [Ferruginibacter sp.]|nr:hypothetical protein [Ferruginibacter sp.]
MLIHIIEGVTGDYSNNTRTILNISILPVLFLSIFFFKKNKKIAAYIIGGFGIQLNVFLVCYLVGTSLGSYLYIFPHLISLVYIFKDRKDRKLLIAFSITTLVFYVITLLLSTYNAIDPSYSEYSIKKIYTISLSTSILVTIILAYMIYRSQDDLFEQIMTSKKKEFQVEIHSIINAQERDRERTANDIQVLIFNTEKTLANFLITPITTSKNQLPSKSDSLQNNLKELLNYCENLYPTVIRSIGLVNYIKEYISEISKNHSIYIDFICTYPLKKIGSLDDEVSLFRIVQDFLQILVTHGTSKNVIIELEIGEDNIKLYLFQDDYSFNFLSSNLKYYIEDLNTRILYFNGSIHPGVNEKKSFTIIELPKHDN